MAILLNDNLNVASVKHVDARYGPHASTTAAKAAIPSYKRYKGLTVGILTGGTGDVVEYWFAAGTADTDLIEKVTSAAGGVTTKETHWTSTSGQTEFLTIIGYKGTNAEDYIVSVGAVDQIPNVHYTIGANSGTGKLILSVAPPTGTLVSIRAFVGTAVVDTGNAVKIRGVDISSTPPTNGQALAFDYATQVYKPTTISGGGGDGNAITLRGRNIATTVPTDGQVLTWNPNISVWEPVSILGGSTGSVTFTSGIHTVEIPSYARWGRLQATGGDASDPDNGKSVKVNSSTVANGGIVGGTLTGEAIDIPYNLSSFAGGTIVLEITAGVGSASVTLNW